MTAASDTFLRARITARTEVADGLWVIRVDPGGPFPFKAGQYATLGVSTAQRRVERAYSIVSSPYEPELEFFIELVREGELTPLLFQLNVGDTLSLRRSAKGRFLLDTTSTQRTTHLLLCTVTGIAPFVSFARTLLKAWRDGHFDGDQRLFLIHGASHAVEFGYREELERIAREVPWLTYVPTVSRPWETPGWSGETGRVDDVIRKYADQWALDAAHTTAYLCGHPEMIEHGKAILHRHCWGKDAVKEEVYFLPSPAH
jgi:ferredoxin/flavodoxin---NADP+ reductase